MQRQVAGTQNRGDHDDGAGILAEVDIVLNPHVDGDMVAVEAHAGDGADRDAGHGDRILRQQCGSLDEIRADPLVARPDLGQDHQTRQQYRDHGQGDQTDAGPVPVLEGRLARLAPELAFKLRLTGRRVDRTTLDLNH